MIPLSRVWPEIGHKGIYMDSTIHWKIGNGWNYARLGFRKPITGKRAQAPDYRDDIFTKLEYIQASTNLIDPDCAVWDDEWRLLNPAVRKTLFHFRMPKSRSRSPRIELQCCWSTDRANGHQQEQRTMLHTYSEVRNMKSILLKYVDVMGISCCQS